LLKIRTNYKYCQKSESLQRSANNDRALLVPLRTLHVLKIITVQKFKKKTTNTHIFNRKKYNDDVTFPKGALIDEYNYFFCTIYY